MINQKGLRCSDVNNNVNYLGTLCKMCKKYINDPSYVFYLSRDILSENKHQEWLIIMQKTNQTHTNETRIDVIDKECAMFLANKLKVVKILNVNDPESTIVKRCILSPYDHNAKYKLYKIGDIVVEGTIGIKYFRSLMRAYYFRGRPRKYTGRWFEYYGDGQKYEDCDYLNGKKNGRWIMWYNNGYMACCGNYANDIRHGRWIKWFENGQKKEDGLYMNGKKYGKWIEWNQNGTLKM